LVALQAGHEIGRPIEPRSLDRIGMHRCAAGETLRYDLPVAPELGGKNSRPALRRRIAGVGPRDRCRTPGVGIAVAENRLPHCPLRAPVAPWADGIECRVGWPTSNREACR